MKSNIIDVYKSIIKILYMSLEKKCFDSFKGNHLYRGTKITKEEKVKIEDYKKKVKLITMNVKLIFCFLFLLIILVFSKVFISLSEEENKALGFIETPKNNEIGVLYELENDNRDNIGSNALNI